MKRNSDFPEFFSKFLNLTQRDIIYNRYHPRVLKCFAPTAGYLLSLLFIRISILERVTSDKKKTKSKSFVGQENKMSHQTFKVSIVIDEQVENFYVKHFIGE